jgi:hypothetical protein
LTLIKRVPVGNVFPSRSSKATIESLSGVLLGEDDEVSAVSVSGFV